MSESSGNGTAINVPTLEAEAPTSSAPTEPEIQKIDEETKIESGSPTGAVLQKASSVPTSQNFPDGGLRAWLVVAGSFWFAFSSFGFINSFGIFSDYYKRHYLSNYSESSIAWIGSVQLFAMFAGGIVSGRVFDTFGPRWLIFSGSIFIIASKLFMSIATQYWQIFLAQSLCFGLGVSIAFYASLSCISHWFFKKRGIAISVAVAGSSLGGIFYPILLNHLFYNPKIGFGWACRIVGFLDIPIMLFVNYTIRSRLGRRPPGPLLDLSYFKDIRFALFVAGSFLNFIGNFIPFFFIQSVAVQRGMSTSAAFYTLAILNASSLSGRLITGRIADKSGPFNAAIPAVMLSGIFSLISLAVVNPAGIYVFCVLFGMTSGAFVSLGSACSASLCKDLRRLGSMQGCSGICSAIAGLAGTPIAGAIVSASGGSFKYAFVFSGVSMFLGGCSLLMAKLSFKKPFFSKM